MGAYLEKPVTEKHEESGKLFDGSYYALSAMQGWRIHMEVDRLHFIMVSLFHLTHVLGCSHNRNELP